MDSDRTNRTITNIANNSVIRSSDDTKRRVQAVEMYERRRAFFRGEGDGIVERKESRTEYRERRAYYMKERRRKLSKISIVASGGTVVLCLCTWLSSSAVTTSIAEYFRTTQTSLFTVSTQTGFLIFALLSAYMNMTGKYELHHIITCASICAAISNAFVVILPGNTFGFYLCLLSRALVGGCMALIYPTSMKVLGSWVKEAEKRREILCILLGVLCLAVALPHLIRYAVPFSNFRTLMIITSSLTLFASGLAYRILRSGEYLSQRKTSHRSDSTFSFLWEPRFFLPTIGKCGHDWELFTFWTQISKYFETISDGDSKYAAIVAFTCIAAGMLGCFVTSQVSKRVEAEHALIVINLCSMIFMGSLGAVHGAESSNISVAIAIIIGFVVVSDSALYSSILIRGYSHRPRLVGDALAAQMGISTITAVIALYVNPLLIENFGWTVGLLVMSSGSAVSIVSTFFMVLRLKERRRQKV